MKHLAFVTTELFPLTSGGIGRSLHNTLLSMPSEDRQRSVVVIARNDLNLGQAKKVFPDVRWEAVEVAQGVQAKDRYPPKWAYTNTHFHWISVCVLRKLLAIEAGGVDFEYIEFPDWCGLGFATTQEKLFSNAFSAATLAVRLHGTEAVCHSAEAWCTKKTHLSTYDLERKTLRDCDRVIAQLRPVADFTRELFGFDPDEWNSRVTVHASPVKIDQLRKERTLPVRWNTPLAYTSKFQQIKGPDVFVRACVGLMRQCPEYVGEVRFLAHRTDSAAESYLRQLIPDDLRARFRFFDEALPVSQRERLISESVTVFPGSIESFCLAAYEASLLGSLVVLNGDNPAFGPDTPWINGLNCLKRDSSVEGVVEALCRVVRTQPSFAAVDPPKDAFPWQSVKSASCADSLDLEQGELGPLVSVIIPFFNLGNTLPLTLKAIADSSYSNIEVIICDDASTDPASQALIKRLEETTQDLPLRVIRATYNRGLPGARNLAMRYARGKYVLNLDADDLISADFIGNAVQALERSPRHSFVVPQTAYFDEHLPCTPSRQSHYVDFAIFQGEAIASGLFENRFSTATVLCRRSVFEELQYREGLRALEDWDFYLSAAERGLRFIVTNELHFFYRRRRGSMITGLNDRIKKAHRYDDLRRVRFLQLGKIKIPAYAVSAWEVSGEHEQNEVVPQRCQRLSSKIKRLVAKVPRFIQHARGRVGRELARAAKRAARSVRRQK